MAASPWLNSKRLRDYPRLFMIASWAILILNIVLRHGWIGGVTGIMIGGDFISNYSGGYLYHTDIDHLYDPTAQEANQIALIAPSQSQGFAPFISPPHVALAASWMAPIPLSYAFMGWEILNLLCVLASVYLLMKYIVPDGLSISGLSSFQLLIIILSSFAFVVGFLAGQSHGITLLLFTGILLAMLKEKWALAGLLGSVLTYKPQFVLGFLILWLVWGRIRALLSFGILTLLWQIPVILNHGISPYLDYLKFTRMLLYLPYAKESFPISIMATPYALFTTILPYDFAKIVQSFLLVSGMVITISLVFVTWRSRSLPITQRRLALVLAVLFPLLIAPHTLIYDLLILIPGFFLLAYEREISRSLKILVVLIYLGVLFLPLIGFAIKVALPGLIPIALLIYLVKAYFRTNMVAAGS